jgi:copper chaperone CopZ
MRKQLFAVLVAGAMPLGAQVEKVVLETTGISCGVCAAVSEINFKRTPGIDRVTISLALEAIALYYRPGSAFSLDDIHTVLRPLGVGVKKYQITARGHVQEQIGKRFLVAGIDKFVLSSGGSASAIPAATPLWIEGVLNEHVNPIELKVANFRVLKQ